MIMYMSVLQFTFFITFFQQGLETIKLLVLLIWKSPGKSFCSMPPRKHSALQNIGAPPFSGSLVVGAMHLQVTLGPNAAEVAPLCSVMHHGSEGLLPGLASCLTVDMVCPGCRLFLASNQDFPPLTVSHSYGLQTFLGGEIATHRTRHLRVTTPIALAISVECSSSSSPPFPLGLVGNLRKQTSARTCKSPPSVQTVSL